jgi:hypothetical protein
MHFERGIDGDVVVKRLQSVKSVDRWRLRGGEGGRGQGKCVRGVF